MTDKFLDDVAAFARKKALHLIKIAEIKGEMVSEKTIVPTCPCLDGYSVAKAFTMTAVGLLFDDGILDPAERLRDILAEEYPADAHPAFDVLTLDHCLTHRLGHPGGYLDIDGLDATTFDSDYLRQTLCTPPTHTPGEKSVYTDAAFYLVARAVEKRSGKALETLLWERLFLAMGYREAAFSKCPLGHAMGATGLYIRAEDAAKLGALYLHGGLWQGKRLLSEKWVELALARGYELHACGGGKAFGKGGMMGQMVMFVPHADRAVAWYAFESKSMAPLVDFVASYKDY